MTGYISLVTLLPGSVTRRSGESTRGEIMGVFHSIQFLGFFVGATATGALWGVDARLAAATVAAACARGVWSVGGLSRAATGPDEVIRG